MSRNAPPKEIKKKRLRGRLVRVKHVDKTAFVVTLLLVKPGAYEQEHATPLYRSFSLSRNKKINQKLSSAKSYEIVML